MYNYKTTTWNDAVRNKFQLELSNRFENLEINEGNTVQTAYDNETASSFLPKKEKKHKQALGIYSKLRLTELRGAVSKSCQKHRSQKHLIHGELSLN